MHRPINPIAAVKDGRTPPNLGEWHTQNAAAMMKLRDMGVEVILRSTVTDKRQNALAENVIEDCGMQ